MTLRAPFPWFGGKSRVAPLVWTRFGDVPNYVEPFAGSLAVLLGRPHDARTETVNDLDCYLANFWRALQDAPDEVARWADSPVNEAEILARHRWLIEQAAFRESVRSDPHFYDPKIAGWWVWGQCAWIGSGWCAHARVPEQLPHLGNAGMGVHRPTQKLPHLGNAGRGELGEYLASLAIRLRKVRVACGDWSRVLGDSVTYRHGATAVFLDPPYSAEEHSVAYAGGGEDVAAEVRAWAIENGGNTALRIALCGYAGEHDMPPEWECVPWKTRGGYGSQADGRGRENATRERVWFSPGCLRPANDAPSLFDEAAA